MAITIGLYDLLSYIVPGALYLFILNDFLRLIGWQYVDIFSLTQSQNKFGLLELAVFVFVAYLAGNIVEAIRSVILDRQLYYDVAGKTLEKLQRQLSYSDLHIDFEIHDWPILQEVLQVRSPNILQSNERFKANALMMRNFSFAAFLYALVQFALFLEQNSSTQYLVFSLLSLLVMYLTYRRSRRFDEWNYRAIYSQALAYGSNLKEFLENQTPAWHAEIKSKQNNKPKKTR